LQIIAIHRYWHSHWLNLKAHFNQVRHGANILPTITGAADLFFNMLSLILKEEHETNLKPDDVFRKKKNAILSLGQAIFRCNGNLISGYSPCKEKVLVESIKEFYTEQVDKTCKDCKTSKQVCKTCEICKDCKNHPDCHNYLDCQEPNKPNKPAEGCCSCKSVEFALSRRLSESSQKLEDLRLICRRDFYHRFLRDVCVGVSTAYNKAPLPGIPEKYFRCRSVEFFVKYVFYDLNE
jgi:hypothetical protein